MLRHVVALAATIAVLLLVDSGRTAMAFSLASPAFAANGAIPKQHSCEGANRSPELRWSDAPTGTKAFALVVDDPDAPAGTWVHWVVFDLPGDAIGLPEGVPADETVRGGTHGTNSFRKLGYGAPCPPPGTLHHYVFKLYALNVPTALKPGATKEDVLRAIEGHVLGQAELIGTYER
jgi:Raf kinase inhibitor-like YbhB/YbcL family protein